MNRQWSWLTGGTVAAAVALTLITGWPIEAQTSPTIYACRNNVTGALRQVTPPRACVLLVERAVAWPVAPPPGPRGPTGTPGARGPAGPQGLTEPTIATTGGRESLSGSGDDLPDIETNTIGRLLGALPVEAGKYFVVATVSVSPDVTDAESLAGSAACWLEVAGSVADIQIASSREGAVPVRQTLTLSSAVDVPSGEIQVRCADGISTPAFWQNVRITAVRVTTVQNVSAGSN
jgi:hypothetical protein